MRGQREHAGKVAALTAIITSTPWLGKRKYEGRIQKSSLASCLRHWEDLDRFPDHLGILLLIMKCGEITYEH